MKKYDVEGFSALQEKAWNQLNSILNADVIS